MHLYREIENSFGFLEKVFTKESMIEFKQTSVCDLYFYHLGLGTWIRNKLLSSKESVIYSLFVQNGIDNPDDMISMMIILFHYHISYG